MRTRREQDLLAEAIAQLRQQGLAEPLAKDLVDETVRRIADCGLRNPESGTGHRPIRNPQTAIRNVTGWHFKLAAAAVLLLAGYTVGRVTSPDIQELRDALTPAVAASLEPALRQRLSEEMTDHYQVALAGTYVHLKEELTQQYRDDLNRYAMQTLAASNATTNALLGELVQAIDTAQAQDLRRIALTLSQMEAKRMQDRTQLAAGLVSLASHMEDELSQTKKVLAPFLLDDRSREIELLPQPSKTSPNERTKE